MFLHCPLLGLKPLGWYSKPAEAGWRGTARFSGLRDTSRVA
jgi:hypothetical protein